MNRWNENMSTETKTGMLDLKNRDMNDAAANDTTDWPINLNNEATPYNAVFTPATPAVTAATAAAAISPDAHFISSGIKLDTELFLKGNINNMADKDTIDTTPDPDTPSSDTPDASAQDAGSTDSNSPYSLRNRNFAPTPPKP